MNRLFNDSDVMGLSAPSALSINFLNVLIHFNINANK